MGFPCGADVDLKIENQARTYVGPHTKADATPYVGTTFNPQVGGVGESQIHAVLNGSAWYDDDSNPFPLEKNSPASASICEAQVLDVKVTEDNSFPLFSLLPLFPDIKRKARVQIEEIDGLTGLLPIAVRLPQPLSAAAVFYNESSSTKAILAVKPFRQVCIVGEPVCIFDAPPGLGQWTTEPSGTDPGASWASFNVAAQTGVVVATSVRPACGAGTPPAGPPCLDAIPPPSWVGQSVDAFCRQAGSAVQCFDAAGSGTTQTVNSGVHFIRGYGSADTGTGPPQLRTAYLDSQSLACGAYFNSLPSSCTVRLNVKVDLGALLGKYPPPAGNTAPLKASDVQVRYRLVRADGTSSCNYTVQCDLLSSSPNATGVVTFSTTGGGTSPHLPISASSRGNAVALEIRIRNASNASDPDCGGGFTDNCRWFRTASSISESVPPTDAQILSAPIQRSFMGDIDRTGPLKWLRLTVDQDCNMATITDRIIGQYLPGGLDAASQPAGECRAYVVDMGMAGGLARDQDEPPIAFNLGNNSSQRAFVDCDPNIQPDPKEEIVAGCGWPSYSANKFDTTPLCPGTAGFFNVPKPDPFANWPSFRCVLTQTGNSGQVIQGFNERIFKSNNPMCPADDASKYVEGRNYWHRLNNDYTAETFAWDGQGPPGFDGAPKGNTLRNGDPRLVSLFFTTYDSFTDTGNEVYPIVGFGNFYVTGYGETINGAWKGGAPEDPCDKGNDTDPMNGTGNEPPPDLDMSGTRRWVWGHFVKDVTPAPFTTGGSGVLCNPEASFQPCVAVLVE